jgi:hypothetical protein
MITSDREVEDQLLQLQHLPPRIASVTVNGHSEQRPTIVEDKDPIVVVQTREICV